MKYTLMISALFLIVSFILLAFNQLLAASAIFAISMYTLYVTIFNIIELIEEGVIK